MVFPLECATAINLTRPTCIIGAIRVPECRRLADRLKGWHSLSTETKSVNKNLEDGLSVPYIDRFYPSGRGKTLATIYERISTG
jgi:hypothetical protein